MVEPTLQQLTEQVRQLTERVAVLERQLEIHPEETARPAVVETPAKLAPKRDLETRVGLRLVNRVGAITLILGFGFFFRYAVENNWLGEAARVLAGALAGLLLLAGGEWAYRRAQGVFAQGISGAGAAILFLSVYAAFGAYRLIPAGAAFALIAASTALGAGVALRYRSQAIAVLALFGAFLAPVILEGAHLGVWFVPAYIAALDAGFVLLASRRAWRVTEWIALVGTVLFTFQFADAPLRLFVPVYYLLFATRSSAALFVAAHGLLLTRLTQQPKSYWLYAPEWVALSFGGLAILRWRGWYYLANWLVSIAAASWFLGQIGVGLPLTGALLTLTILFAVLFGATAWRAFTAAVSFTTSELAALPLTAAFFFAACYQRLDGWADSWAALLALLLACVYLGMAYLLRDAPAPNLIGLVSGGVAIALFTLAAPLQFHAFQITIVWALEGAALVWIGFLRGAEIARAFGLFVLLFAVARFAALDLFLFAAPDNHRILANARFATALALAFALFLAAAWGRGMRVPVWVPGGMGHLVLLTALSFEVSDWATRFHAANQDNVQSAALSILFAAYAVTLVAFGTANRSAGSRYMGLGLIALVVVKFCLDDIWQLELVYRFIAFAGLGGLLLAMSFLYSRYRERVTNWLTPRDASAVHPPQQPE